MTVPAVFDDVTIVGAGPAGAVAALVLARRGHRVRLLDRARFPRPKLCGDTLNPGALALLGTVADTAPLRAAGLSLDGMRLSGPGGAQVEGRYPPGVAGLSIRRCDLDAWLVARAVAAGATFDDGVLVRGPIVVDGAVSGVVFATAAGDRPHRSRIVLAADGRASVLARACGLASTPVRPRRWALGTYAEGVGGIDSSLGEMHVRAGGYLGLAPVPGGLTNVCLVVPRARAAAAVADPWAAIQAAVARDPALGPRLAAARPAAPPVVLGPMALDTSDAGVPGLLLAGDAAGFVDPMTGDGLRFAIAGGLLAAEIAADVLDGACPAADAPHALARRRHAAFATKWRFNRGVRALVDAAPLVRAAAWAARCWPGAFEALVRYAGDARRAA